MKNGDNRNEKEWGKWIISQSEFKGFVKAKMETIEEELKDHNKCLLQVKKDIQNMKEWVSAQDAVRKYKASVFGFFGGIISIGIGIILKIILKIDI